MLTRNQIGGAVELVADLVSDVDSGDLLAIGVEELTLLGAGVLEARPSQVHLYERQTRMI